MSNDQNNESDIPETSPAQAPTPTATTGTFTPPTVTVQPAEPAVADPAAGVIQPTADEVVPVDDAAYTAHLDELRAVEKIGVVAPGDTDGLATLVVRSLGMGDGGVYEGAVVDAVKALQEKASLEPDGIVAGATWALILRPIRRGASGHEVAILHTLLGTQGGTTFDDQLVEAVGADRIDSDFWKVLIEGAV